ncbi:MAG: rRNA pseudouridine synthase [Neisseriaceae bacterium]|nr:rRNA pseudouridine synthase [Neisseriaceae bacterium]
MNTELVRLSKHMAQLNLCSRREADEYIEKGWVLVNGKPAVLGQKVCATDKIELLSKAQQNIHNKITVILHKPVGYVSSQPEKNYLSALSLITADNFYSPNNEPMPKLPIKGLAPAGRLDIDSTGLLLLTQNGVLAKKIIGEESLIKKEYLVRIQGKLDEQGLKLLNFGLSLDGKKLKPAIVTRQNEQQLKFILQEGKKRQIRRMCALVGVKVIGLKRVRIGKIKLADLPLGKWRVLKDNEQI